MCVIIDRQPGVSIPAEKLDCASIINKDGFGFSFIHKGRLVTERSTDKNDPKVIADLLQKHKDKRVFLHLRHATMGDVSLKNSHPFILAKQEEDEIDVHLMHNGTLIGWDCQDKSFSDTFMFSTHFLSPFIQRTACFLEPKETLDDFLLKEVLNKYAGFSVFLLYDNFGNVLRINEDKGKQFEGWWASNEYSFRTSHQRYPSQNGSSIWNRGEHNELFRSSDQRPYNSNELPWEQVPPKRVVMTNWEDLVKDGGPNYDGIMAEDDGGTRFPAPTPDETRLVYELGKVRDIIMATNESNASVVQRGAISQDIAVHRTPFIGEANVASLEQVCRLSRGQLEEMCEEYPKASAQLFIDLIARVFPNTIGSNKS